MDQPKGQMCLSVPISGVCSYFLQTRLLDIVHLLYFFLAFYCYPHWILIRTVHTILRDSKFSTNSSLRISLLVQTMLFLSNCVVFGMFYWFTYRNGNKWCVLWQAINSFLRYNTDSSFDFVTFLCFNDGQISVKWLNKTEVKKQQHCTSPFSEQLTEMSEKRCQKKNNETASESLEKYCLRKISQ